ncbi:hypothetical protein [Microbispora sp. H13382]|uniref:hypothetical protein n=1 Tax=Microbispora sp. H13382 TaxID=2729112 RepID=UPI001601A513|nr:hypothetical protein [Microbispora sp. H13382]
MHPRCYFWTGVGDDRRNEAERGLPPPSGDPGPFLASPLPPTCDWLLKPRTRIDVSPGSAGEAREWLTERYRAAESHRCPAS